MNNNNNNNNDNSRLKSLRAKIDWDQQARFPFVVEDPFQPGTLVYLTLKDYLVLMRTQLRNSDSLFVVARPGSTRDDDDLK